MDDDLRALWQRMKPTVLERCEIVRAASAATADDEARVDARAAAHKLAGSIGMYGLVDASSIAVRIDELIVDGALADGRADVVAGLVDELVTAVEDDR